jgi:hypothetical protein
VLATKDVAPGPRFPALSASLQAHRAKWLFPRLDGQGDTPRHNVDCVVGGSRSTFTANTIDGASRRQGDPPSDRTIGFRRDDRSTRAQTEALGFGRSAAINLIFPLTVLFVVNTLLYTHL